MIAFQDRLRADQQSLFYPRYSPNAPDCMAENMRRANELVPYPQVLNRRALGAERRHERRRHLVDANAGGHSRW